MRTKMLTVCLLLTTAVVVGCGGNQKPKLPGQESSPFPGAIAGAQPPALTPAEVEAAKEAAASSPEEQKVRELAVQLKSKARTAAGQKAISQSDDYFIALAREQIRKDSEQERKNQLVWAKALSNAHVSGCRGVIPNPEVERDVNLATSSIVRVSAINASGITLEIRTGYRGAGVAVSNFCPGGGIELLFYLGYPERNYVQNMNVVLIATGKRGNGTTFTNTISFPLYNNCVYNSTYCNLQRDNIPWKIE